MLHLWLRACVEIFFLIDCLSHFTHFWDWIKCRVSDGLLYRLSLEPAARLMNQFSILIPSFNAHKYVYPVCWVPKKEFFYYLKLPRSTIKKSEEKYVFGRLRPSLIVFISLQKTNTTFVFRHILKYVVLWSKSKNTFRYFCLIVDFRSLVIIIIIFVKL